MTSIPPSVYYSSSNTEYSTNSYPSTNNSSSDSTKPSSPSTIPIFNTSSSVYYSSTNAGYGYYGYSVANSTEEPIKVKREANVEELTPLLDIFLNPDRYQEKKMMEDIMRNLTKTFFSSSSLSSIFPNLFELLWYSNQPCCPLPGLNTNNLLKKCEWQGKDTNCSDLFKTVPTDSGMCCAFNRDEALKESSYLDMVRKMQKADRKIMNKDETTQEESIRNVKVGKRNGLRLVLDQHSNKVSFGTVSQDFNGFQVFIGTPEEFPAMKERSLLIQPGYENSVEVSGYVVGSSPEVQNLPPADRNCFFLDEGDLSLHKKYSYSSCKLECSISSVESKLGCVPWYIPHTEASSICDPWQAMEFTRLLEEVKMENCSKTCLPDCQAVIYSFTHSTAEFRYLPASYLACITILILQEM